MVFNLLTPADSARRAVPGYLSCSESAYRLCDVVDDDGAVCVPVVHWCKRLVPLLASSIPYLKLDCCGFVEGDGLGEESGADG